MIDYDGAGGQDPVDVVRDSNTFTLDGLNVSVNGTFGLKPVLDINGNPTYEEKMDADGNPEKDANGIQVYDKTKPILDVLIVPDSSEVVKMTAQPQTDKIIEAMKQISRL